MIVRLVVKTSRLTRDRYFADFFSRLSQRRIYVLDTVFGLAERGLKFALVLIDIPRDALQVKRLNERAVTSKDSLRACSVARLIAFNMSLCSLFGFSNFSGRKSFARSEA